MSTDRKERTNKAAATELGRREFLLTTAAISASSLIASSTEAATSSGHTIDIPGAEELVPENMPTGFSKAEMERRWKKAREWMREEKFDCLLVPARHAPSLERRSGEGA